MVIILHKMCQKRFSNIYLNHNINHEFRGIFPNESSMSPKELILISG